MPQPKTANTAAARKTAGKGKAKLTEAAAPAATKATGKARAAGRTGGKGR